MAWTDERVETLKKLWAEGLSASQIAKELGGVTRNAVIGKVHRLGLSGRATPSRPPARVSTPRPRPAARPARPATFVDRVVASRTEPTKPAIEAEPLPNGEFATVLTLSNHICKWPIGDPGDKDFRFCGRKTMPGIPYCDKHACMAYQPAKRRRRKEEDASTALDAIAANRRLSW